MSQCWSEGENLCFININAAPASETISSCCINSSPSCLRHNNLIIWQHGSELQLPLFAEHGWSMRVVNIFHSSQSYWSEPSIWPQQHASKHTEVSGGLTGRQTGGTSKHPGEPKLQTNLAAALWPLRGSLCVFMTAGESKQTSWHTGRGAEEEV